MRMIHPGLIFLMRLQGRSILRRIVRGVTRPRGAIFFACGLLMTLLWLGPTVVAGLLKPREHAEAAARVVPWVLLGFALLSFRASAADVGIYFSPSEVDFLFSGPFTRRELLLFKVVKAAGSAALVSLFFSLAMLRYVTWWVAAYIGCFLAFLFITLLSMSVALLAQTVGEKAYSLTRKLVLWGLALVGVLILWRSLLATQPGSILEVVGQLGESPAGRCVLAPFQILSHTITATSLVPELLGWMAASLALNGALLVLVLSLDTNYLEAALSTSQRIYARLQQIRSGRSVTGWSVAAASRWRLPMPPRLGGAGTIAWRQLTSSLRGSTGLLLIVAPIALIAIVSLRSASSHERFAALVPGLIVWTTVFFSVMLRYDFRSELDHLDWIKALPIAPWAVATGELTAPTVVLTALQLAVLGVMGVVLEPARAQVLFMAPFVLPLNWLLFGLENLFFLLFPMRNLHPSPGDFQAMGRQMVVMFAKLMLLGACCSLAGGVGFLGYWLAGRSWLVLGVVSWTLVTVQAVAVVPCVAWAYRNFDVSLDTPGE